MALGEKEIQIKALRSMEVAVLVETAVDSTAKLNLGPLASAARPYSRILESRRVQ